MTIIVFEDVGYRKLNPLCLARPVFDLRCGMDTLMTKYRRIWPEASFSLQVRPYLAKFTEKSFPDFPVNPPRSDQSEILAINGRWLPDETSIQAIMNLKAGTALFDGNTLIATKCGADQWSGSDPLSNDFTDQISSIPGMNVKQISIRTIDFPWDLIAENGHQIEVDFAFHTQGQPTISGQLSEGVICNNTNAIHIEPGAVIKPGVVLDAEEGPIFIDKNAKVFPNAFLEGPLYLGENSLIKAGAKIYENTSIGPVCKVGGEVEESVIHSYSNKQHEGFLGHAYLGSWVNIGADSNNSDLKNNYGYVKMMIDGEMVDSGTQFLGLIMGDHSKLGINSTMNTGTVVGFNCNLYGPQLHSKYVPSFAWGSGGEYTVYKLDKAIEVATRVMARRKVEFDDSYRELFETIYENSVEDRRQYNMLI